eukprot:700246-Karenia_brevis.AAC.1
MATTVPHKGGRGMFAVDKCVDLVGENGDSKRDILMKSDTEESMELLVKCIKEERHEGRTVVEEAPKKVKGSNRAVSYTHLTLPTICSV